MGIVNIQRGLRAAAWSLCLLPGLSLASADTAAISKARQDCASHKQHVRQLERSHAGDAEISRARRNWELACFRAHALMKGLDTEPLPPVASPPVRLRMAGSIDATPRPPLRAIPSSKPSSAAGTGQRSRFKVTILDPVDEALRMEPPRTHGAGPQPTLNGQPVPLF